MSEKTLERLENGVESVSDESYIEVAETLGISHETNKKHIKYLESLEELMKFKYIRKANTKLISKNYNDEQLDLIEELLKEVSVEDPTPIFGLGDRYSYPDEVGINEALEEVRRIKKVKSYTDKFDKANLRVFLNMRKEYEIKEEKVRYFDNNDESNCTGEGYEYPLTDTYALEIYFVNIELDKGNKNYLNIPNNDYYTYKEERKEIATHEQSYWGSEEALLEEHQDLLLEDEKEEFNEYLEKKKAMKTEFEKEVTKDTAVEILKELISLGDEIEKNCEIKISSYYINPLNVHLSRVYVDVEVLNYNLLEEFKKISTLNNTPQLLEALWKRIKRDDIDIYFCLEYEENYYL